MFADAVFVLDFRRREGLMVKVSLKTVDQRTGEVVHRLKGPSLHCLIGLGQSANSRLGNDVLCVQGGSDSEQCIKSTASARSSQRAVINAVLLIDSTLGS